MMWYVLGTSLPTSQIDRWAAQSYWLAFKKLNLPISKKAPIHVSKYHNPNQSPSLAPGEKIPELNLKIGGSRKKNKVSKSKCIGKKTKTPRSKIFVEQLKKDVELNPENHDREYVYEESWDLQQVPCPTTEQLKKQTTYRGVDKQGVYRHYVKIPDVYYPRAHKDLTVNPKDVEAMFPRIGNCIWL